MKIKLTSLLFLSMAFGMPKLEAQNIQKCASFDAMHLQEQVQPGYIQSTQNLFQDFYSIPSNRAASDTFLYVRVVVHIVYNKPEENLADSVVYNQIQVLNEDYGRLNPDSVNLRPVFQPVTGVDSRIRFLLADTDPQGNPTNGITRTQTSTTSFFNLGGSGIAEGVKSTASGGIDPWDQSRFLNIWVCNMSIPFIGPAVLGYAIPPAGLPNWDPNSTTGISDGVVIQFQVFGANNPNIISAGGTTYIARGRTPVHEIGHYLGLRHIWGDATNCAGNDGILDTPRATDKSNSDCDASKNTCVDTIAGIDMPDMIENYMDYSAETCQNSFTKDQIDFVRWVLRSKRPDIFTVSFTGIPELKNQHAFSIWPNPANESVTISNDNGDVISEVALYNTAGQRILTQRNHKSDILIQTSQLKQGIYYIEMLTPNSVSRSKLFVTH